MPPPNEDTGLRCLQCDYNLTGIQADHCPECGWRIDHDLTAFARDRRPSDTQRLLLGILCGFVGLVPFCLVTGVLSFGPAIPWRPAPPDLMSVAFPAATMVCAFLHLLMAFYMIPAAATWPMTRPQFALVTRVVALLQIIAAALTAIRHVGSAGLVDFFLVFLFASGIGWVLLFATAIAFTSDKDRIRQLRSEHARLPDEPSTAAPVILHVAGRFAPDQIDVVFDDAPRTGNIETEAAIEATWQKQLADAKAHQRVLHNGCIGRLVGASMKNERLILRIGNTTYREFIGTNLHNADLAGKYGPSCLADPLGTSATVLTADGYLLYGRRSDRVANHAGFVHTFGGMLEPKDQRMDKSYDVFTAVRRELCEELRLTDDEIVDLICTGLVRDRATRQPELVFDAALRLTRHEVLTRFDRQEDDEHSGIESCLDDPEAVYPFIQRCQPFVPVAQGALLLHGRGQWGNDWYENTAYVLYGDLPQRQPPDQNDTIERES